MDKIYIDDNLIQIDLKTNKKEEVIKSLAQKMLEKNIVKNSYLDAVLKREEDYPTALKTNNINFAIPHTDPEHVKKPALAVALLNNEVNFTSMENYEEEIGVKLVFL
ncbi:MAG: PTS sugar transporter subunit IIA, partial [Halanaerobium sp. MSAO_Bac5]